MATLPAEAALFCSGLITYLLDRGDGRAGRPAGLGYHGMHAVQATIADVHARPGDQLLDLLLILSAERARQEVSRSGHSPTVPKQHVPRLSPGMDGDAGKAKIRPDDGADEHVTA
jgi:hypothetical protein